MLSAELVASDMTVIASLDGPDVLAVPRRFRHKAMAKLLALPTLPVTSKTAISDGILKALNSGPDKSRRTMAQAGTHVVVVEGPPAALVQDKEFLDKKGKQLFLIPYENAKQQCKVQKFGLFHGGVKRYKEVIASRPRFRNKFNQILDSECTGTLSLMSYNLADYKCGLMFVFVSN